MDIEVRTLKYVDYFDFRFEVVKRAVNLFSDKQFSAAAECDRIFIDRAEFKSYNWFNFEDLREDIEYVDAEDPFILKLFDEVVVPLAKELDFVGDITFCML